MRRLRNALLGAAVGLAVLAGTAPAHADTAGAVAALQDGLNKSVAAGYPGAIGLVQNGTSSTYVTAGHSINGSSTPIDPTGQYRIGSQTKLYTATVILQLEAEGKLSIDDTVAKWLPNALHSNGYDGRIVTIRQLLNHTSGVADYLDAPAGYIFNQPVSVAYVYYNTDLRGNHYTPQNLVDTAVTQPPTQRGVWAYSNTDYILAGMIIQAVTGHDPSVEITNRIITPLHLTGTSFPVSDTNLYGNFVHGWHRALFGLTDASASNVEILWAAGAMVSTLQDQATFVRSLIQGQLLPSAQMAELETTVDAPDPDEPQLQQRYGLGISSLVLPGCQKRVWVHGGRALGYNSRWFASEDGTKVIVQMGNEEDGTADTPSISAARTGVRTSMCQLLS
ncbi:serine hydrolase domain-containing protein [Yinghuangia seranimata]|uniref:serine hydrolase domain-containing protein n=1 Tax=Yinghuangia seranimata TaxID=408067 RepID=UPI00248B66FB|nr:serine hydrolase domain-containing protein [Yinghuangia seranimata]MDI2127681.1 serine hydrolase domain-containing protein [Yinghuangia seranimata]